VLCIIVIIGTAFLLTGNKDSGGKSASDAATQLPTQFEGEETEKRLEKILSKIRGVEDVEVMITYDGTGKRSYVREVSREQMKDEHKSSTSESTSVVTAKDTPVIETEVYPQVRGVLVVAKGVQSAGVREQIVLAVKAVLDVEEHRIGVFAK